MIFASLDSLFSRDFRRKTGAHFFASRASRFDTPCTVELEHSDDRLCAHVDLGNGVLIGPGDRVRVHGAPIAVRFGERRIIERIATVERAGLAGRLWTKIAGYFEITELYEVSFTDRTVA